MSQNVVDLLPYSARTSAGNMALDEALLESNPARPILRLYAWTPPTISLGRFQYPEGVVREALESFVVEHQFGIVRRATGGGAILHHQEITYAFVCPLCHEFLTDGREGLYRKMHHAWMDALQALSNENLGLSFAGESLDCPVNEKELLCFARRTEFDVIAPRSDNDASQVPAAFAPAANFDEGKVIGSAQRRSKNAILQHGSVKILSGLEGPWTKPGLAETSEKSLEKIANAVQPSLVDALGFETNETGIEAAILARAAEIEAQKYATPEWTWQAKLP